jgi:hypothetical protein
LARPDVPVFRQAAVGRLDLRLPFPGVADIRQDAECLLVAALDAVRPVCLDMVGAIPEVRRGLQVRRVWAAGKLAGRAPRLADAVPAHPDPAWVAFLGLPASVGLEVRWVRLRAAAELCTPDEALSAA